MNRHAFAYLATTLFLTACPGEDKGDDTGDPPGTDPSGILADPAGTDDDSGSTTDTAEPTSTGGISATEDTGSTTDDFVCFEENILAEVLVPQIVLVLDKSGSMVNANGYWDADGDDADDDGFVDGDPNMTPATPRVTRWNSLHAVVTTLVDGFEDRLDFGAVLFPSRDAEEDYSAIACPVNAEPEVPVGADQGQAILAAIPTADDTDFHGGTPAAAGVETGTAALVDLDPTRPKFLVLITDGAANCATDAPDNATRFEVYDEQLPQAVADAHAQGISTFVVGIDIKNTVSGAVKDGNPDNINTYEKLNAVAEAGGMARQGEEKFYNTVNQVELQAALESISKQITSCELNLSEPLKKNYDVERLIVDPKGGTPLEYDRDEVADCATESGWHFKDEERQVIELCGAACELYKSTGQVDIDFMCADF